MEDRIRVFVYAGDPISETGIAGQLRGQPGIHVVAEADVDSAAVAIVVTDEVDADSKRAIKALQRNGVPRVLVVVTRVDDAGLLAALEVGACGILRRAEARPDRLVTAIRAAVAGDGTMPPDLLGRLLDQVGRLQRQVLAPRGLTLAGLAEREIEVLRLIADGLDTSEIASRLCYSQRTVKNVIHDVTSRLQLRNRSHAVAYAMREGLDLIDAIDEAVRTLIRRDALNGSDIEVVFDAPTRDWAARRNAPTVDVYLYDIREDLRRRANGTSEVRDASTGFVVGRNSPPRYFKFSYLVTAWTQRPEDEHRLLSALLTCFLRFAVLPPDVLPRSLDGFRPLVVGIGRPPVDDRPVSDVWSALGGELKPSLDLTVTAALEPANLADVEIAPPVLEPRIRVASADGAEDGPRGASRRRPRPTPPRAAVTEEVIGGSTVQPGRTLRIRDSSVRPRP